MEGYDDENNRLTYESFRGKNVVDRRWTYVANDDVENRQFRLPVCAINRLDLDQGSLISGFDDHNDQKLTPPLTVGPFEKSFRALSAETSGLEVEDLEEVEKIVAERLAKRSEEFEAFGMKFPIAQITTWGTVTILGVQLYFFLYLRWLSGKLGPDDPGWDVPWVCLDQSFLAQAIFFVTVVVLPFAAMVLLGVRASLRLTSGYFPDSWHNHLPLRDWEGIVLAQIALFVLAALIALGLGTLCWRFRPRLSDVTEQHCPAQLFE